MAILPSGYQEVEYIQSSGTQRIDTGYAPTTSTEFEADYEIASYITQYSSVFGTRYAHNSQAYYIGYENDNTSYYCFGNNKVDPSTVYFHGVGTRRKVTYHNNVLSNGSQSVTVATNQTPYGTIRIFCEEQNGNTQGYAAIKLYSFKLREGSTLTRNFVPCYRKSDDEIGLYDLVNNQFYTNSGTGTFIKGPRVLPDYRIKKIYLGTDLIRPSRKTTEYVLLSEGGSVNKFSELSLNGIKCVSNNTSNWLGNVTSTDKFGIHYKQFDKPIVGFEFSMKANYSTNNYEQVHTYIIPSPSNITSAAIRYINTGYEFNQRGKVYQGASYGDVGLFKRLSGTGTTLLQQSKSSGAAVGVRRGELKDGVWHFSVELSTGQSWSCDDTANVGDLYTIGFQGRRRYTGATGQRNYINVILRG